MIFFISDTHFSDQSNMENEKRPFKNVKKFDKFLIKIWNKQAKKSDTIYVIGDFIDCDGAEFLTWQKGLKVVKKIKANVVLVMGNNEDRVVKYFFNGKFNNFKEYCLKLGFKDVVKNKIIAINNKKYFLTHKPTNCKADMMNLFGHIHKKGGIYRSFGFNMCCDLNFFRLYSELDIKQLEDERKKFWLKSKDLNLMEIRTNGKY